MVETHFKSPSEQSFQGNQDLWLLENISWPGLPIYFYFDPGNAPGKVSKLFGGTLRKISDAAHPRMKTVINFYYDGAAILHVGDFYPGSQGKHITGASISCLSENFPAGSRPALELVTVKTCKAVYNPVVGAF